MSKTRKDQQAASAEASGAHSPTHDLQAERAPMTDRVNVEPPIMNGMTASEAKIVGSLALVANLIVGGIAAFAIGIWQVLLGFVVVGTLAVVWRTSIWLASTKRGKPDGFHIQRMRLWAARKGFGSAQFISHDSAWELGRPMPGRKR
jgi:conjugative transfer region protein (TIGR03750 family)